MDLVYAVSVFTHLTTTWSTWLAELHRILDRDGVLLITFMGPGIGEWISGQPWDEKRTGMFAFREGQSWDLGGPMVLHSSWWIAEHWGRAFDVLGLRPDGFSGVRGGPSQGIVALRKRDAPVVPEELERIAPEEAREALALAHNLEYVQREIVALREAHTEAQRELARLADAHDALVGSRSWRLTAPLRRAASRARRRLRPR